MKTTRLKLELDGVPIIITMNPIIEDGGNGSESEGDNTMPQKTVTVSIGPVHENHTLSVTTQPVTPPPPGPFTITEISDGHAGFSPGNNPVVNDGEMISIAIVADDGFEIVSYDLDGEETVV